ncbi:hypothetical protein QO004_004017 [Rhizobium mesoamericanum]|uniref:hypothetical protein n=1 Tax=Rhizobium mesoamericanum TaxID=1079800 RepID=UPI00277DCA03|nr:hypothetical protein [Rhizobium mesoamericanum]MDQ0562212.1 hypothetical protein [Rhizobium mesoamericanum]
MILVLASELDAAARDAVRDWPDGLARLMTPADLSIAGWFVPTDRVRDAILVASGRPVPAPMIGGIVNLLPVIGEHELFDVEPEARSYVAAEASAFLLYLLTMMPCRIVNRPTSECLNGPNWRPEQWSRACSMVGIPTAPIIRDSKHQAAPVGKARADTVSVSLLDGQVIGAQLPRSINSVRRLAALAGTCFIKVNFVEYAAEWVFHSAELAPDLTDGAIRAALVSYFHER